MINIVFGTGVAPSGHTLTPKAKQFKIPDIIWRYSEQSFDVIFLRNLALGLVLSGKMYLLESD